MARLITEKINNLEKEVELLKLNTSLDEPTRVDALRELEQRMSDAESKINKLIDEITPVLTSHANALKELMSKLNQTSRQ